MCLCHRKNYGTSNWYFGCSCNEIIANKHRLFSSLFIFKIHCCDGKQNAKRKKTNQNQQKIGRKMAFCSTNGRTRCCIAPSQYIFISHARSPACQTMIYTAEITMDKLQAKVLPHIIYFRRNKNRDEKFAEQRARERVYVFWFRLKQSEVHTIFCYEQ